jgi:flagellar basal body-associated protein FliL
LSVKSQTKCSSFVVIIMIIMIIMLMLMFMFMLNINVTMFDMADCPGLGSATNTTAFSQRHHWRRVRLAERVLVHVRQSAAATHRPTRHRHWRRSSSSSGNTTTNSSAAVRVPLCHHALVGGSLAIDNSPKLRCARASVSVALAQLCALAAAAAIADLLRWQLRQSHWRAPNAPVQLRRAPKSQCEAARRTRRRSRARRRRASATARRSACHSRPSSLASACNCSACRKSDRGDDTAVVVVVLVVVVVAAVVATVSVVLLVGALSNTLPRNRLCAFV